MIFYYEGGIKVAIMEKDIDKIADKILDKFSVYIFKRNIQYDPTRYKFKKFR